MTDEQPQPQPKPKQYHPEGSPTVRKIGNAIKFTICGQSWIIGAGQVLKLIRNRKDYTPFRAHYLNPLIKEQARGVTFMRKWIKMRRYIAYKYLKEEEEALIAEKKGYSAYLRRKEELYALKMGIKAEEALICKLEDKSALFGLKWEKQCPICKM